MDVSISFHATQWLNLTDKARQLISQYCGPLYPDADGVLTLTVSEARWAEIEKANQPPAPAGGFPRRRR